MIVVGCRTWSGVTTAMWWCTTSAMACLMNIAVQPSGSARGFNLLH